MSEEGFPSGSRLALAAAALVGAGIAVGYLIGSRRTGSGRNRMNSMIRLNEKKVAETMDFEEIGEKKSLCRCWKSKKWPLCDGAHKEHNRLTGDNVGPIRIVAKKKEIEN